MKNSELYYNWLMDLNDEYITSEDELKEIISKISSETIMKLIDEV